MFILREVALSEMLSKQFLHLAKALISLIRLASCFHVAKEFPCACRLCGDYDADKKRKKKRKTSQLESCGGNLKVAVGAGSCWIIFQHTWSEKVLILLCDVHGSLIHFSLAIHNAYTYTHQRSLFAIKLLTRKIHRHYTHTRELE